MSKVVRYDADQIEAGDIIAIKEGRIRRFYHVCEVHIYGSSVHIVYRAHNGFVHMHLTESDRISIRE